MIAILDELGWNWLCSQVSMKLDSGSDDKMSLSDAPKKRRGFPVVVCEVDEVWWDEKEDKLVG